VRRSTSTAGSNHRPGGAVGACSDASRRAPSAPTASAYARRFCAPRGSRSSSTRRPYRSNHSGAATVRNQSGAASATALSARRNVSATRSSRFSTRSAPSTRVESVRWRPRAVR
jgi:hypothetical protein